MNGGPIIISIKTALLATILTFFVGIFMAAKIHKRHKKIQMILDALFTLPMVIPPTVAGFILLQLFGINGPIGRLLKEIGVRVIFTWEATVIAAFVVSFPLMYRSVRAGFEQVDSNLIYAARTLGLSDCYIFWRIMIPLSYPSIMTGGILAFARAIGEFGATIMIAGNIPGVTQTLPLAIYTATQRGDISESYQWVGVMVVISLFAVIMMNIYSFQNGIRKKG